MVAFVAALALPLLAAASDTVEVDAAAPVAVAEAAAPAPAGVAPAASVAAPVVVAEDEGANPWITIASGGVGGALGMASLVASFPLIADAEGSFSPAALLIPVAVTSATVVGARLVQDDPSALNVTLPAVGAVVGLASGVAVAFIASIPLQGSDVSPALVYGYGAGGVIGAAAGTALGVVTASAFEE